MRLKKLIFGFAVSVLLYYLTAFQKDKTVLPKKEDTQTKQEFDYLPSSTTNNVIKHTFFTLSYSEKHEQAEWVAYDLKASNLVNTKFKRPFFAQDPKVNTESADRNNYKKSGYDKGHLCPAADMKFSQDAYNDTFFTSNISPQTHAFNTGVWERLEEKTRYWATQYGQIFVVTGGVLENNLKKIGQEHVSVPNAFYKILFYNADEKSKMIAFLIPHAKSDEPLFHFATSVDVVEKLTGIDFFPKLDDKIETRLEKMSDYKYWIY